VIVGIAVGDGQARMDDERADSSTKHSVLISTTSDISRLSSSGGRGIGGNDHLH